MDLLIAFIIFIASMVCCLAIDISMVYALLVGLILFLYVGMRRGFKLKALYWMSLSSIKDSLVVIKIMLVIGMLAATWRISGTITVFVYYGMKVITPPLFLLIAFLLSCLLSYALGTSFGVSGTVGVIFMALARSGGVDPVIAAGVIMSGVYFGDRCSPVSSSAQLVAGITKTDILKNVKIMFKTAAIPFVVTLAFYTFLSLRNPIQHVDESIVSAFENSFSLSVWAFIPAVLMLVLPLVKLSVSKSMWISIASGVIISWCVQGAGAAEIVKTCIFGYKAQGGELGEILNGGGLVSMIEVSLILIISSAYSGIFSGTKMLESLQDKLAKACEKTGRFEIMVALSIVSACIFCNQTITTLMCNSILGEAYIKTGGDNQELAIDIENSGILIGCTVPWSIGCTVPLAFMDAPVSAMLYAS